MSWSDLELTRPPSIVAAGIGVHGHADEEAYGRTGSWWFNLYTYRGEVLVDGAIFEIIPGRVALIPPACDVTYRFRGRSIHTAVHFTLEGERQQHVPLVTDLGDQFDRLEALTREIIAWHARGERSRTSARLWDVLFDIAAGTAERVGGRVPHPSLLQAMEIVNLRLAGPISVRELAAEVGVSHNHLTRLFRSGTGRTVAGYVRGRRMEQARYYLGQTDLPIKAIAPLVGIPDLHYFNKVVRVSLGQSPRSIRASLRSNVSS